MAVAVACKGSSGPEGAVVARVEVTPATVQLAPGATQQFSAQPRDAGGAAVARSVTWSSGNGAVASVSPNGLVTALAAGTTAVTATAGGVSGSAQVSVAQPGAQLTLVGVQFTQAVQNTAGTLPLVTGTAAVANILARATPQAAGVRVMLRLWRNGGVVRSDTVVTGALGSTADYAAPSAQVLLPASAIVTGTSWEVVLDPAAQVADPDRTDNRIPSVGQSPMTVVTLPTLRVRFVPILLGAHGNPSGNVTSANVEDYLGVVRALLPTGPLSTSIGSPVTVSPSFGTAPNGGTTAFWTTAVQELDLARVMDPATSTHTWYGVVRPPTTFNFVTNGGWSYIPTDPTSTGPGTRTSMGVQTGWFNNTRLHRELVAHELGHTFGRRHAPSCGAGGPFDPAFPDPAGTIGGIGHDVAAWSLGAAASARTVTATTGDIMGYCSPPWIGAYTYDQVRRWREAGGTASRAAPEQPVVVVAGLVFPDGSFTVRPAFSASLAAVSEPPSARVRARVEDDAGRVLARRLVATAVMAHGDGTESFTAILPSAGMAQRIVLEVGSRADTLVAAAPLDDPEVHLTRQSGGWIDLAWDAGRFRALVARHPSSGAVLGFGWGGRATILAPGGAVVELSNGLRSARARLTSR